MRINLKYIVILLGSLMLFCCLFDPQDKLFGLKVPSFILFFISVIIYKYISNKGHKIPFDLLLFIGLFSIFIPFVSTIFSTFTLSENQELQYLKAYIFLLLSILFYYSEFNFLAVFIKLLNCLTFINVFLFIIIILFPSLISTIYSFGDNYTIFSMPTKHYGSFTYLALYIHITPLFIVLLGHNLYKYFHYHGLKHFILLFINVAALFICGSRSNILSTLIMIFIFYFLFNKKIFFGQLILICLAAILVFYIPNLIELFSKPDSDDTKFEFAREYLNIFNDPSVILFGQGIGSSFNTSSRGLVSITELTYFEIFRRLGIFLGTIQVFLMLYPLTFWNKVQDNNKWLIISYAFYLLMSFFNPFYFNSSGMILLSFVLVSKYNFNNVLAKNIQ